MNTRKILAAVVKSWHCIPKFSNRIQSRIWAAVASAALILGGMTMLVGDDAKQAVKTAEMQDFTVSREAREVLDQLAAETEPATDPTEQDATETQTAPIETMPEKTMQELLQTANDLHDAYTDAIGWLYIPGTSIDYPVMQGEDNEFYLHHAYDGSHLMAGSVFLDCRCEQHFLNPINVTYAHNMKNGTMFADVRKFEDTAFFNEHLHGWLAASDRVYRLDFFSLAHADCEDAIYDGSQTINNWMIRLRGLSGIWEPVSYDENDRFISLSTCTNATGGDRTILTGKLVEMTGGDMDG